MTESRFPFSALIAIVAVLLFVIGAYVLGTVHRSPGGDKAGIVVAGKGSVTAVPDQARFSLGVQHREATVDAAMTKTDAGVRKVLAALEKAGVAKKDVKTTNLSVEPVYDYKAGDEKIVGYRASQQLSVQVRRLDDAGKVMAAAAAAAGDAARIDGLRLTIGEKGDLLAQARAKAIKDARKRAEEFADAAGRSVGKLVFVQEVDAEMPSPMPVAEMDGVFRASAKSLNDMSISAGEQKVTVRVNVRWSLK